MFLRCWIICIRYVGEADKLNCKACRREVRIKIVLSVETIGIMAESKDFEVY